VPGSGGSGVKARGRVPCSRSPGRIGEAKNGVLGRFRAWRDGQRKRLASTGSGSGLPGTVSNGLRN
jgi:hypothetical protein